MGLDLFVPSLAVWLDLSPLVLCFELLLLGSVLEACLTWLELLSFCCYRIYFGRF